MSTTDLDAYRALVDRAPTMLWRTRADGERDFFNATWLAFTGHTPEPEDPSTWSTALHPDDVQEYLKTLREHFERRESYELEYRLRRADGAYRFVLERGAPLTDDAGRFVGFVGSCVDVDERRAVRTPTGADDFFELSLDNICVAGLDGYFKRVNPAWTRTLGWTTEELMARPSLDFVHPDDRPAVLEVRHRLRRGESVHGITNRYLCKDGSFRWFEWRPAVHTSRGLVYAVARDITEQRHAEERLRAAEADQIQLRRQLVFADRMASIGTLAAGVAHEINNPLTQVLANAALQLEALREAGDATEMSRMAAEVLAAAERIQKIVRGLKTFSRAEEEHRRIVDVGPLLDLSIGMTANEVRQHGARVVTSIGPMPPVEADEARLGQVFVNLLVNAAQAFPVDAAEKEIRVRASTDASGRVVIEVQDTGMGIPPAQVDRIFDPFFTTKPVGVGTGLGLSICHNLVTALGGEISVSSVVGRGATFRVTLPPAAAAPAPALVSAPPEAPPQGVRVLVVDDEPTIGSLLRRSLRDHTVTALTDAREALALLELGERYDVIISDLMMPEMTGMAFYEVLTRRFPDAAERVVFITGGAFTPATAAFLDRNTRPLVEKPFRPATIREVVEQTARARR